MYVCMYVYKYSVHIYLLCMTTVSDVVVVCGECYNLGLIDRSVVFVLSPPLKILKTLKLQGKSSLTLQWEPFF